MTSQDANSKDYREIVAELVDNQGWRYEIGKGHPKLFPADRRHGPIIIPTTPGDTRSFKNTIGYIRRSGGIRPPKGREREAVTAYSVLIETRTDGRGVITDDAERFADLVEPYHGVVSPGGDPPGWSARITVDDAVGATRAVESAARIVLGLAEQAGLPGWPVVRAEAVREDVYEEDQAQPQLPDLVSGPEAAEILGVSTQRVHQLAAEHPRFPEPKYRIAAASLWLRPAIVAFGERWERKPGRPRKTPDMAYSRGVVVEVTGPEHGADEPTEEMRPAGARAPRSGRGENCERGLACGGPGAS